jgi:NAD(P)H-dependent FMN reductase
MSRVVAIVGSYRRGGTTDAAVEAILAGAREKGAETHTIYLTEHPIQFCTNCRKCVQAAGETRRMCVQQDGLEAMLRQIDAADSVVLGSPVNFGNVTAIFRRFLERLIGSAYWPWGQNAPASRSNRMTRKAVLVATSAMPGFLIPLTTGTGKALNMAAARLGARPVGSLWIGLAGAEPLHELSVRTREKARHLGWKLG